MLEKRKSGHVWPGYIEIKKVRLKLLETGTFFLPGVHLKGIDLLGTSEPA